MIATYYGFWFKRATPMTVDIQIKYVIRARVGDQAVPGGARKDTRICYEKGDEFQPTTPDFPWNQIPKLYVLLAL